MSRFNTNTFRSLNESIARIQNPQATLDEAMEYTALLETVLLALCEELELDPNTLLEDIQTFDRKSETYAEVRRLQRERDAARRKNTAEGDKQERSASAKLRHRYKRNDKEHFSKELYAKGGKVVRKGTAEHKRELARSNKQKAAYEKASQKKYDAKMARIMKDPAARELYHAQMAGYGNVQSYRKATQPKGLDPNDGYAGWQ